MHVLLRAPRGFAHPAWTPRQNLTRTLEGQLKAFLDDAVVPVAPDGVQTERKKRQRLGVRTEGVWVSCAGREVELPQEIGTGEEVSEEDEMIWWVWDGKIVGFSEW